MTYINRPGRVPIMRTHPTVSTLRCTLALSCVLAFLAIQPTVCSAPPPSIDHYDVTDLGTLATVQFPSQGLGLSDELDATGNGLTTNGSNHAFSWANGRIVDLDAGQSAVNSGGEAARRVGGSLKIVGSRNNRATIWSGGTPQDLGTLGGSTSFARDIAPNGWVVGAAQDAAMVFPKAFVRKTTTLEDLGTLGGVNADARATDGSNIVGWANLANSAQHACLWRETGEKVDLGTLGGLHSEAWDLATVAGALWVVGRSNPTGSGNQQAFVSRDGVMSGLPTLGGTSATAFSLNSAGQIVGNAASPAGPLRAVIWENGAITDLNSRIPAGSGFTLLEARTINEDGYIVGTGVVNGVGHAVLLSPNPNAAGSPDLRGSWSTFTVATKNGGRKITGKIRVENRGNAGSGGSQLRFYVSQDTRLDGADTLVVIAGEAPLVVQVPSIAQGGSKLITFPALTVSRASLASYRGKYLLGVADDLRVIFESNEFNNAFASKKIN